jgi:DNA-binding LacI/PurR family transcriptional regulator
MKNRTRLEDIAKRVGVSKMAVSLALRGDPSIGKDTVEEIKRVADELNYVPNKIAQGLACGKSYTIAAIVGGDLHDDYHNRFLRGAIEHAISRGYTLTVGLTEGDIKIETDIISKFRQMMVDGYLIFHCGDSANYALMKEEGIPFVLYTKYFEDFDCNYVVCDDVLGGYRMTKYFISLGHKRIAFVYDQGLEKSSEVVNRLKGYKAALQESGIPFESGWVQPYRFSFKASDFSQQNPALAQYLHSGDAPTAIFVCNDVVASAFYIAIKSMGYRIPQDFSIAGYEGVYLCDVLDPALTTVSSPIREMGQRASKLLIDTIEGIVPLDETSKISLEPTLTLRDSVMPR